MIGQGVEDVLDEAEEQGGTGREDAGDDFEAAGEDGVPAVGCAGIGGILGIGDGVFEIDHADFYGDIEEEQQQAEDAAGYTGYGELGKGSHAATTLITTPRARHETR